MRPEVEHIRGEDPAGHQHQRAGNRRCQEPHGEDHAQRDESHDEGRPVRLAQRADPRRELPPRVRAVGRGPGQLGQLTDHDVDRRARQEAGDHRLGQEPRDPAHPEDGEQQEQHPGNERDRRHQLRGLVAADAGQKHRATGHRGERRARAGRDLPGGAEQRVDERARRRRVQPVLQRHSGDSRVPQVLRDDQRRHRDAGGQVAAQPGAIVPWQPCQDREQMAQPAPRPARRTPARSGVVRGLVHPRESAGVPTRARHPNRMIAGVLPRARRGPPSPRSP